MSTQTAGLEIPSAREINYPMAHDELRAIDLQADPLSPARVTNREFGLRVPLLAKIEAGKQLFSILDTRDTDAYASPFLVVSNSIKRGARFGFKGIWLDDTVEIGRRYHKDRFKYDGTVSARHFSIALQDIDTSLLIQNHTPMNRTYISGALVDADLTRGLDLSNIRAEFTDVIRNDKEESSNFGFGDSEAPHDYYNNHPIIGRKSTTVKNGVYFTTRPMSEAVVVDDKTRILQQTSMNMLRTIESKLGNTPTANIELMLKLVNEFTQRVMPYSTSGAERLSEPHYDDNGLIGLSKYVKEGVGVCRHQCLLAAFLVETLADNMILPSQGRVGVERNRDIDAHGAHAWSIYETASGTVYVIDPAQNFVGTKEQARLEGRWKYDLPEED